MSGKYWTVCQVMPGIEHKIRADIEKGERGAFLPTLAKTWVSTGKVSSRECTAMPGYVFFVTSGDDWGEVDAIEGVQRVLTYATADRDLAIRISDHEMSRMVLDHATGRHDYVDRNARLAPPKGERKRRRRSRPGRRIRKTTNRNRTDMGSASQIMQGSRPTALREALPPAG